MSDSLMQHESARPEAPAGDGRPPWFDPEPGRPVPFWASVRADLLCHFVPGQLDGMSPARRALAMLGVVVRSSGFHVGLNYRIGHAARALGPPGVLLSGLMFWWNRHAYNCSIAGSARIHGGLILPHPQGIVIGAGSEIGPRAWIYQNVTLGGAPHRPGMPRVGSDARLYVGAVLSGAVRLGDHVSVGANAVVSRDVPDHCMVRAAPVVVSEARPVPRRDDDGAAG